MLRDIFDEADADGSGYLDVEELTASKSVPCDLSDCEPVQEILARLGQLTGKPVATDEATLRTKEYHQTDIPLHLCAAVVCVAV